MCEIHGLTPATSVSWVSASQQPGIVAQGDPSPAAAAVESPAPAASAGRSSLDGQTTVLAAGTTTPWLQPVVETDPNKRVQWPSTSVVFEADALRIRARGRVFNGIISAEFVQSSAGVDDRDYDVMWHENGREMRMDISFESDGADYWIREWMVYDGRKAPGWVVFKGPLFVTPRDEPMEADVRLAKGKRERKVELTVDGMRIHAFHPGSGPAALTGCTPPVPLDAEAIAEQRLAQLRATFTDEEWEAYRKARDPRIRREGLTLEESLLAEFRRQVASDPVVQPPRADDGDPPRRAGLSSRAGPSPSTSSGTPASGRCPWPTSRPCCARRECATSSRTGSSTSGRVARPRSRRSAGARHRPGVPAGPSSTSSRAAATRTTAGPARPTSRR